LKKTYMTMFLLLACSVALAAAQSQDQPQSDQQNTPYSSSSQMGKNVTLTGCLEQGAEPNSFVLNKANLSDQNRSSYRERSDQSQSQQDYPDQEAQSNNPDSTEPTDQIQSQTDSGNLPSEMARAESSYALIPEGRVDLKSHIGHRVEVTGKIMESSSEMTQSSTATTPSGQWSTMKSTTEVTGQPQLRVSSIRHISDTCQ